MGLESLSQIPPVEIFAIVATRSARDLTWQMDIARPTSRQCPVPLLPSSPMSTTSMQVGFTYSGWWRWPLQERELQISPLSVELNPDKLTSIEKELPVTDDELRLSELPLIRELADRIRRKRNTARMGK